MNQLITSLVLLFTVSGGAHAVDELMCGYTVKVSEGFRTVSSESLSVLEMDPEGNGFVLPADAPDGVAAINCFRDVVIPVPTDRRVLDAGFTLYLHGIGRGQPLVRLTLEGGKVISKLMGGKLSKKEKRELAAALSLLNQVRDSD